MTTLVLGFSESSEASDSKIWAGSFLASCILYALFLVGGTILWKLWRSTGPVISMSQNVKATDRASTDVLDRIKKIELKYQESVAQKTALEISKPKIMTPAKATPQRKTFSAPKSLALQFKLILQKSEALSQSAVKIAQTEQSTQVFDLKPVAESVSKASDLLVAERLNDSTYQGAIQESIAAPQGLIYPPKREEWEIRGGLPLELIQMVVEENELQLRFCYEIELLKIPQLQGEVQSEWTIQSDGSLSSLAFRSDAFHDSGLFGCLQKKMAGWKFPKPEGGSLVHVKYPMKFYRREAP